MMGKYVVFSLFLAWRSVSRQRSAISFQPSAVSNEYKVSNFF